MSSGHGRGLIHKRLLVRIPIPDTGWTFLALICYKIVFFEKTEIDEKEAGDCPLKTKKTSKNSFKSAWPFGTFKNI